jgi:hypothetical protein
MKSTEINALFDALLRMLQQTAKFRLMRMIRKHSKNSEIYQQLLREVYAPLYCSLVTEFLAKTILRGS